MSSRKTKVFALSLGRSVEAVVGIGTMMLMARVLLKEDLAAYRQTILAFSVAAPLLELGIGNGLYYFLPNEKERIRGRVMDAVTVLVALGALFGLFIAFGGNRFLAKNFDNPSVAQMLLWMIPFAIVQAPANQLGNVLVARDRAVMAAGFGLARQVLIGIATVIPLLIWKTPLSALVGRVVSGVVIGLIFILVTIRTTPKGNGSPSLDGMKELLKFSVPLGMATMIGTLSLQMDKLIVGFMCDPEQFAEFALGAIEVPFLSAVTGSITAVLLADMRRAVASGNKMEALRLFRMTAEKSALLIFPAALFLAVCAGPFIETLWSEDYAESAEPFKIYLLNLPFRVVVFGSLLMALGKNMFILRRSIYGLVVGGALKVILVHFMGPLGAAWGGVLVAYVYIVPMNLRAIGNGIGVSWVSTLPFTSLGKVFLMSLPVPILAWPVAYLLREQFPVVQLVAASAVAGVYCLWWWNGELYSFSEVLGAIRQKLKLGNRPKRNP